MAICVKSSHHRVNRFESSRLLTMCVNGKQTTTVSLRELWEEGVVGNGRVGGMVVVAIIAARHPVEFRVWDNPLL